MKPSTRTLWGLTSAATLVAALAPAALASGHAETLVAFDPEAGQLSEGVAVAPDGDVYASLSPIGQLVRISDATGDPEVVGTVEGLVEGDFGLIGLAVGPDGAVYGGVISSVPELTGVWRFDPDAGDATRVPGTEGISFANEPAFDDAGTMYVSDTTGGAVWRVPAGEVTTIATVDDGLDGRTSVALGPAGTDYIANFSVALGTPLGAGPGIVAIEVE